MILEYYLKKLGYPNNMPDFMYKYIRNYSLNRLKNITYLCGMDYASKDIYDFKEKITRYDHSISVSLLTYKLTQDKTMTLAGLFHDISTPCFSHVIDYMNNDYEKQESTEQYTEEIIKSKNNFIRDYLKRDKINIDDIINFKKYSIVDIERPKCCADRLDGVILAGITWTKNIEKEDIDLILDDLCIYKNENNMDEIGFKSYDVAKKIVDVNESINNNCYSNYDTYMMMLLAKITKKLIDLKIIDYMDLYYYDEEQLFEIIESTRYNEEIDVLLNTFYNIKKDEIPNMELPKIKKRELNPLVNGERFIK